jgi:hypothetical protein
MARAAAIAVLIAIASALASSASALTGNCWGRLKVPLEKGGFGIGTECDDYYSLRILYAGRTNGARRYRIYSAIYVIKSVTGGPGHGGDRILIFDDRLRYVGHYRIGIPNYPRLWVKGATVHLDGPAKWGNVIRLNGPQPPEEIILAGEQVGFSK